MSRFPPEQHRALADHALRDGFVVLRDHFPVAKLDRWNETFLPLLDQHIAREGHLRNRGPSRYYVTLPFLAPFADPAFLEDDDVLAIVELLAGEDPVLCQLATDTPLKGSDYQDLHRDTPPLFPEWGRETPAVPAGDQFSPGRRDDGDGTGGNRARYPHDEPRRKPARRRDVIDPARNQSPCGAAT